MKNKRNVSTYKIKENNYYEPSRPIYKKPFGWIVYPIIYKNHKYTVFVNFHKNIRKNRCIHIGVVIFEYSNLNFIHHSGVFLWSGQFLVLELNDNQMDDIKMASEREILEIYLEQVITSIFEKYDIFQNNKIE